MFKLRLLETILTHWQPSTTSTNASPSPASVVQRLFTLMSGCASSLDLDPTLIAGEGLYARRVSAVPITASYTRSVWVEILEYILTCICVANIILLCASYINGILSLCASHIKGILFLCTSYIDGILSVCASYIDGIFALILSIYCCY